MANDRQTVPVHCKKCNRFLVGAIPGSWTLCPDCQTWTQAEIKKEVK